MSVPVRVLLVAPQYPPDIGGLASYVGWLARLLAERPDFEVEVVTVTDERRRFIEDVDGIRVHRLPAWGRISNTPINPWWVWQVRRLIRELRPDVINAHSPVPFIADVAVLVAGEVPVVLTYHAGSLVKGGNRFVDAILRFYERHVLARVFRRSAALVAVSPVSTAYGTGRAELIPPGVDSSLFHVPEVAGRRAPRILFAGRIETTSAWKGLHVLMAALPAVVEAVPDVVLDMVGDGDLVSVLQAQADQLGVAEHVLWHGAKSPAEVAAVMRDVAVVTLPSLTEAESFGMLLVEAMASGCPVVASRVGGIPGVVRDGVDGLLVEPGDATGLAEQLTRVLLDPQLAAALGAQGRRAVEERWDWRWQADKSLELLARVGGAPVPASLPRQQS